MPPFPFLSPGYQFWTVEYLICASSSATSSTTAAWSWFSSRIGAVQPSRYETDAPASAPLRVLANGLGEGAEDDAHLGELLAERRRHRDAVEDRVDGHTGQPLALAQGNT